MTEEGPAEVVRAMTDAWNRRDGDAILAMSSPEVEYVNPPDAVEPGTRRGADALADVFRKQWDALGDGRQEIEELHERGDEVIAVVRLVRTMPGSDAEITAMGVIAWTISGGKVARVAIVGAGSNYEAAREAAGI